MSVEFDCFVISFITIAEECPAIHEVCRRYDVIVSERICLELNVT